MIVITQYFISCFSAGLLEPDNIYTKYNIFMDNPIYMITKLTGIFLTIEFLFELDDEFDLNKFSKSIDKVSNQLGISIKLININDYSLLLNSEIYICINNKKMLFKCSHKYYDTASVYAILNAIDNNYLNLNTNETIYLGDKFIENDFIFSSLLNNIIRSPSNFELSDDLVLFKNVTNNNSIELINNIQDLFKEHNLLIIINTRKNLNINVNTLGFYSTAYFCKSDENDFISKIKNIKNISEIPNPSIKDVLFNDNVIFINSYLKYKLPSFCVRTIPSVSLPFQYPYIFITPKNKEGISSIYMNKKLYNLYLYIKMINVINTIKNENQKI